MHKGVLRTAVIFVAALGLHNTGSQRPAVAATRFLDATFAVDIQREVPYGSATTIDGAAITLTLNIYTPRGDTASSRPVFIFAHGGFFFLGSKDDGDAIRWATQMAQRGYVAASIDYRLSSFPVVAPADTAQELQEINDAREDMQTSVRWFKAHADILKIDPNRIAVGGSSAGAVTALGVALNATDPGVGDNPDLSSAVCTAVSISGANDPFAADAGDAGAIFHHGETDFIVPFETAVQTRDAMSNVGLAVQWNQYPDEGHILGSATQALIQKSTVQWLFDHVATAAYPCSAAVAHQSRVGPRRQTILSSQANRSAVVSLIAVESGGPGYLQFLNCADQPGASSNLNVDAVNQIRSVLAVVRFNANGKACVYNEPRAHLVADVQGYFTPGAFDDIVDERLLDTRAAPSRLAARSQTMILGRPNATGVVSLVSTDTTGPGYIQVLTCGTAPGAASNLNADALGQTRATLAFVRFDSAGKACIFNETPMHLVADLQGYVGDLAFDDVVDQRLLDTRGHAKPGEASVTQIAGRPNSTAVVSLLATQTEGSGFVQVLPCGTQPGHSSNLNIDHANQTMAGLAVIRFSNVGTACVYTQHPAHLVVDLQGYLADGAFDKLASDVRILDTRVGH